MGMFSWLTDISGTIGNILLYVLYALPFIILLTWVVIKVRNKKIYQYPVRIFRQRESGNVKEINTRGGFIDRKGGTPFFRIRMGRWGWKFKDLSETPKLKYIDEDDRVYYKQIDINTYIQMKREIVGGVETRDYETDEIGLIKLIPVETDVKYGAILAIQRIKEVLKPNDKWKTIASIGGMILIFALAIIGWALMMNSKCPAL